MSKEPEFKLGDRLLCVDIEPFQGMVSPITLGKIYTPFYDYSEVSGVVDVTCDDGRVRGLQKSRFRLVEGEKGVAAQP